MIKKTQKKYKLSIIFFIIILCSFLPACDDVEIFKKDTDPYALVPVKDKDLEEETYYVKNNTNFYVVHHPEGSGNGSASYLQESRVLMVDKNISLIPTLYKDELIAFKTEKLDALSRIILERYENLGYSLGGYNGTYLSDKQMMYFEIKNITTTSDLKYTIDATGDKSKDIRISTINSKPILKENVDQIAGIISGLEQDKEYKVGYYLGSAYHEANIKADSCALKAYEIFIFDKSHIIDTPNGYFAFEMPADLKSGYYQINGAGLFKYYNFKRGDVDETSIDMNESYYKDERSKIEAYSRQYNVNIPQRVKDFKVTVEYGLNQETSEDAISGIAFAPDDTRFDMEVNTENKTISLSMAEAMAGDWTINIIPKSLDIINVTVDNDKATQEATCEETQISLPEDRENIEFVAEYTVFNKKTKIDDLTMYGIIMSEDGKTYELSTWKDEGDKKDKTDAKYYIGYELPFAKSGVYTVRIYHYPEETTVGPVIVEDKMETKTDVIIIDDSGEVTSQETTTETKRQSDTEENNIEETDDMRNNPDSFGELPSN